MLLMTLNCNYLELNISFYWVMDTFWLSFYLGNLLFVDYLMKQKVKFLFPFDWKKIFLTLFIRIITVWLLAVHAFGLQQMLSKSEPSSKQNSFMSSASNFLLESRIAEKASWAFIILCLVVMASKFDHLIKY